MKHRRLILLLSLPAVSLVILVLLLPAKLSGFLSKSVRVDANILIIEGWLSYNDLLLAADEFTKGGYDLVITSGLRSTPDYYNVNTDGYLIFYTGKSGIPDSITRIAVRARSELDGEHAAHFNLWVNDSLVKDFHAGKRRRKYEVKWDGSPVDSVMVQFDNDKMGSFGDRNLYVRELILNNEVRIPFLNNTVYDISELDNRNRITNNMDSNAGLTSARLLSMGVDSSSVIAVAGKNSRINRTLASAVAVRDFIDRSSLNIKGINIISAGAHSRRTWMTFKRVLNTEDIGIISLSDIRGYQGFSKLLRETLAYIYYSLILVLY
jgi:hypothetical protein